VKLVALAPAKVNLCLFLGPTRDDGRHELVTLFESVSLADELTLETETEHDAVVCRDVPEPNLVTRALGQLRARGWDGPPVSIEVVKRIPVAAGMGGGSADAAAALRLASQLAPGRPEELFAVAGSLGSDVPSQLMPGLTVGTGAGDEIEPYGPLASHAFVIVPQSVRLSTADVYREADRLGLPRVADELSRLYPALVGALRPGGRLDDALLVNDLEPAALSLCPSIGEALDAVRAAGADHAIVCGSGPTVAGLYWGSDAAARAEAAAASLAGAVAAVPVGAEFGLPRFA
jgi:4-diphosphocytidyl-2-C-methyl-D-erythritol kinase